MHSLTRVREISRMELACAIQEAHSRACAHDDLCAWHSTLATHSVMQVRQLGREHA